MFVGFFLFFMVWQPTPAYAAQAMAQVTCADSAGATITRQIGWDNENSYFLDKGNIPQHYCEGGFAGQFTSFVGVVSSDGSELDLALLYHPGYIAPSPVNPTPSPEPLPETETTVRTDQVERTETVERTEDVARTEETVREPEPVAPVAPIAPTPTPEASSGSGVGSGVGAGATGATGTTGSGSLTVSSVRATSSVRSTVSVRSTSSVLTVVSVCGKASGLGVGATGSGAT